MENPNKIKRQRSENWNEEDKMLLKDLIRDRVKAIENKNTDSNTNHSKKKAWLEVTESFNNLCTGGQRTVTQLKNQWVATKILAKKKDAERRKELAKTGGGSGPQDLPVSSHDLSVWLPNEFFVDTNEFDSDAVTIEINEDSLKHTSPMLEEHLIEDETTEPLETVQPKSTPNIKKKIPSKSDSTEHHVRQLAEFDLKCRPELHEHQLEVERKRKEVEEKKIRNLDREYDLIESKIRFYDQKSLNRKQEDYM